MILAILGRLPALGMAELEAVYGSNNTKWFSSQAALIDHDEFLLDSIGGTLKAGRVVSELQGGDWHRVSTKVVQSYTRSWSGQNSKITLGISAYGFDVSHRDVQKTGIILKQKLKQQNVSLRLIPNNEPALNTAASHHNKLGLSPNKVELLIVKNRDGRIIIAESTGSQNISAYAARDQGRPKRDAFVGMLPPKLAQIMLNLAFSSNAPLHHLLPSGRSMDEPSSAHGARLALNEDIPAAERAEAARHSQNVMTVIEFPETSAARERADVGTQHRSRREAVCEYLGDDQNQLLPVLLDPFCGTGVILQEAAILGYSVYGTDLSEKMIRYSRDNLNWLQDTHGIKFDYNLEMGDAIEARWQQPINAVVSETYLGQPFSAPPSPDKLAKVQQNCDIIISRFLQNIARQIKPGTPLCLAVPAWRDSSGRITHLTLINDLQQLGYKKRIFKNIKPEDLIYFRADQIVARELLVLFKS